jgi:hypothetical protein
MQLAFQARLTSFASSTEASKEPEPHVPRPHRGKNRRRASVDKSVLALPAPRRVRDREHIKTVAKQACLVCGRRPADAHHLRFAQAPALGRKVSDEFTLRAPRPIPLHHRANKAQINPGLYSSLDESRGSGHD